MNLALAGTALVLGLAGSLHCVVMCGGVASALDSTRNPGRFAGYHFGRILSYLSAGAVAGALGSAHKMVPVASAQGWMRVIAGLLMAMFGLHLLGLFSGIQSLERIGKPLWDRVAPTLRSWLPARSVPHAIIVGLLWGWMPCGLVYSGLVQSLASGNAVDGALVMALFGLATVPALAVAALAGGRLLNAARLSTRLRIVAGVVMLAWGVISLSAGLPTPGNTHCQTH